MWKIETKTKVKDGKSKKLAVHKYPTEEEANAARQTLICLSTSNWKKTIGNKTYRTGSIWVSHPVYVEE